MRGRQLVERRFEVLTTATVLALAFIAVVWVAMVIVRATHPTAVNANLLLDILPWVTPTVIVLILGAPLYSRVAGILAGADDWPRALAAARYRLLVGSAFALLGYTVLVWVVMVALRAWDPVDFHYNFVVDWLPAILPPWLAWLVGGPVLFRLLGVLGGVTPARAYRFTRAWAAGSLALLGAAFLTFGGIVLNQGVYAGTEGAGPLTGQAMVAFGTLLLTVGGGCWAGLLATLAGGLAARPVTAARLTPLDRFRLARPRLLVESFIHVNALVAVVGLLMVGLQYVDAQDFHWYLALDLWLIAGPILFAWMVLAALAYLVPARLADRVPGHWGAQGLVATGPVGAEDGAGWGSRASGHPGLPPAGAEPGWRRPGAR